MTVGEVFGPEPSLQPMSHSDSQQPLANQMRNSLLPLDTSFCQGTTDCSLTLTKPKVRRPKGDCGKVFSDVSFLKVGR